MDAIHLSRPIRTYDGESTLATCTISMPSRRPQDLWIRTSGEAAVESADPFVALALLRAMITGLPLVSEGPVSRSLLHSGIPAIQAIYSVWGCDLGDPRRRRFHAVEVEAPVAEDAGPAGGVGLFFSNGVDSSFSLIEGRDEITDLVFIYNWELEAADQANPELSRVLNVARGFGKGVTTADTNAKSVVLYPPSWRYLHGAMLAAIALELQGRLSKMRIAATYDIRRLQPWGSHPCLDHLWSTGATRIVHDRIDVTRLEKLAVIADDRLLMENLRVCGEPEHLYDPCIKCARTMFALQALDRYEQGLPFGRPPLTPWEIARVNWSTCEYPEYIEEIVEYLAEAGSHPELLRAVRIARSGIFYHGPGRLVRGNLRQRLKARAVRELPRMNRWLRSKVPGWGAAPDG